MKYIFRNWYICCVTTKYITMGIKNTKTSAAKSSGIPQEKKIRKFTYRDKLNLVLRDVLLEINESRVM